MDKKAKNVRSLIKSALFGAQTLVKKHGEKKNFKIPKTLTSSKVGNGFWIPMFAGLSAVGALTSVVSGIVSAVNTHSKA